MPRKIPYSIIDVFTETRFQGNPVAVIRNATELNHAEMQAIAKEFGFSETTFILPPKNPDSTAEVKIFTPVEEIPFAGHPNIGTAFVMASADTVVNKILPNQRVVFDELGGSVAVRLQYNNKLIVGATISAPQALTILGNCDIELLGQCLGLGAQKLISSRITPCVATVGLPFAFAEVADLNSLSNINLSIQHFQHAKALGPETVDGFAVCAFVVLGESDKEIHLRTRVFSPLGHPPEDPATGSASGALAALLTPTEKETAYRVYIEQGVEMGRASQITVDMKSANSRPEISGKCICVSEGVLYLS